MNRDSVTEDIQLITSNNILLELPTSFGKTRQALDLMSKRSPKSILILVPRLVLINNWKKEFAKWGYTDYLKYVTFSTYVGIKKYKDTEFDMLIADECHHFTEKSLDYIHTIKVKSNILLSATVGKFKDELKANFTDLYCYQISMNKAMDSNILPYPRVYLIPYTLDNIAGIHTLTLRESKKGKSVTCNYADRWKYLKDKSYTTVTAICTQHEYIFEISQKIDYLKRMYMRGRNEALKNKWLYLAGLRLKMLSNFKNPIIINLQVMLRNYRYITFCNSVEQTELLGKNCINYKNKQSAGILDSFNEGNIKHITSCNMLNEGMNLVDCQIGIYASLNSSEIMIKQKIGRLLRHTQPVLIIPYYKGTRDEEIVERMLEDYNKELITEVDNLNDIKI